MSNAIPQDSMLWGFQSQVIREEFSKLHLGHIQVDVNYPLHKQFGSNNIEKYWVKEN